MRLLYTIVVVQSTEHPGFYEATFADEKAYARTKEFAIALLLQKIADELKKDV